MIPYAWTMLESGACKPPQSPIRWHVQKILQFLMTFINMVKPENQVQAHCIRLWMLDKPPQKVRKRKRKKVQRSVPDNTHQHGLEAIVDLIRVWDITT
jgi:hypothetical protein